MPREEDHQFPLFGLLALIPTGLAILFGSWLAIAWFVFLTFAAPACFLWGAISALKTSFGQGLASAISLLGSLCATVAFYYYVSISSTRPPVAAPVFAGALAIRLYAVDRSPWA